MRSLIDMIILIFFLAFLYACEHAANASNASPQDVEPSFTDQIQEWQLQLHVDIYDTLRIMSQPVLQWENVHSKTCNVERSLPELENI